MSKLEQLPQVTDHVLNGLRADDALKARIYQKAVQEEPARSSGFTRRGALIALCSLSAVMIAVFAILGTIQPSDTKAGPDETNTVLASVEIETVSAGERRSSSPFALQSVIDETIRQYDDIDEEPKDAEIEEAAEPTEDPGEDPESTPTASAAP